MSGKVGKFVRLTNTVFEGGKMVPVEEWGNHVNFNTEGYRSVGVYTPEQVEIYKSQKGLLKPGVKGEGAVRGITGVKSNCLVIDLDGEDLNQVKEDAKVVISRLQDIYKLAPENINICFTGSKGFAIEIFLDKEYTGQELKAAAESLTKEIDSWDSSLYDDNQLIRIPGTRHPKTGLYKTSLTVNEIENLTIDQIKEKAKTPGSVDWTEFPNSLPEKLFYKVITKQSNVVNFEGDLDFSTNTLGMPNWKFAILHGFFPPGKRHDCMLALASYFKGAGFPIEVTKNMVLEASRLQFERNYDHYNGKDPTDEGELTRTIEHIYGPTWTGGTFAYETNEKLKKSILDLFPEEALLEEQEEINKPIKTISEMISSSKHFMKNIEVNRIYTGMPEVDRNIILTTGAMHGLLASPGAGKTALAINMLAHNSKLGLQCMFFSLDMSENLIGAKLIARQNPIGFRELTELYKNNVDMSNIEALVEDDFKNVAFYSKSATTVKDMKLQILKHQKNIGQKVKFVVVDYLELLSGPYSDQTANSAHHAVQLKDLATDLDICLIILIQPQKSAGDASYPLTSMRQVKGASLLEQNFRNILGIYREGFSPDTPELDKFLTVKGLKSSFEGLFSVDVGWDGKTGRVYTLDQNGRNQLARIRDAKKEKAEADKSSKWDG